MPWAVDLAAGASSQGWAFRVHCRCLVHSPLCIAASQAELLQGLPWLSLRRPGAGWRHSCESSCPGSNSVRATGFRWAGKRLLKCFLWDQPGKFPTWWQQRALAPSRRGLPAFCDLLSCRARPKRSPPPLPPPGSPLLRQ